MTRNYKINKIQILQTLRDSLLIYYQLSLRIRLMVI